jgi:hypothetical protein
MQYILQAALIGLVLYAAGSLLLSLYRVVARWHHNNMQPVRTVHARLVHKEHNVWLNGGNKATWNASSTFRATFQLSATHECLTFSLNEAHYATLGEPGTALLTYQGTRFLGFETEADDV